MICIYFDRWWGLFLFFLPSSFLFMFEMLNYTCVLRVVRFCVNVDCE